MAASAMVDSSSVVFALIILIAVGAGSVESLRRGVGEEEDVLEVGVGGGGGGGGRNDVQEAAAHDHVQGGRGGCSGGCSAASSRLRARPVLLGPVVYEAAPVRELDVRPRPLFGLIGNILETVRYGRDIDDHRPHILF